MHAFRAINMHGAQPVFFPLCTMASWWQGLSGLTWIISQLAVADGSWSSLMKCPNRCPGFAGVFGARFVQFFCAEFCNTIQVCLKNKQSACYPDVKNQILRSRPACGAAAPFMHRFLIKYLILVDQIPMHHGKPIEYSFWFPSQTCLSQEWIWRHIMGS